MQISIKYKFFLIIFLTSCITAMGMYTYVQWGFDKGYVEYLNEEDKQKTEKIVRELEGLYKEHGSWDFMLGNHRQWVKITDGVELPYTPGKEIEALKSEDEKIKMRNELKVIAPPPGVVFGPRVSLRDIHKEKIIGGRPVRKTEKIEFIPINVNEEVVGYLGYILIGDISNIGEIQFFKKKTQGLLLSGLFMVALALIITIPMVNYFLRSVVSLMQGTAKIKSGELDYRVSKTSNDELGRLVDYFNSLAETLERNTEMRKRLVADVSHELRTPLAILRGKIEAMIDGVRKTDVETLSSLHNETLRIERLISNLYELSMADVGALKYKMVEVDPASLLEETIDLHESQFQKAGIRLEENFSSERILPTYADPDRLQQLFVNLLQNTLRYTDGPGQLNIDMETDSGKLQIVFEDSAPGVPEDSLTKLFDRLYRVDESRNRAKGGSGLGLAICKNIVEAHNGKIFASQSSLGGLKMTIHLPLSKDKVNNDES